MYCCRMKNKSKPTLTWHLTCDVILCTRNWELRDGDIHVFLHTFFTLSCLSLTTLQSNFHPHFWETEARRWNAVRGFELQRKVHTPPQEHSMMPHVRPWLGININVRVAGFGKALLSIAPILPHFLSLLTPDFLPCTSLQTMNGKMQEEIITLLR